MTSYVNIDGLKLKFGTEEVDVIQGGSFRRHDSEAVTEIEINLTDLAVADTLADLKVFDNVQIPEGRIVTKVEVFTETVATSGGAATLNIGVIATDYTTVTDVDGIVVDLGLAAMSTAGETTVVQINDATAGALMGVALAATGVLVADVDTAVYTAGRVLVRVYHYQPQV